MQHLTDVVPELERELQAITPRIALNVGKPRDRATLSLVLANYSEVVLILKRIVKEQEEYKEFQRRSGSEEKTAMLFMFQVGPLLNLDIKPLYIWCHQICSIFRKRQVPIDVGELKRISLVRNKFLTHIAEQPLLDHSMAARGGMTFDAQLENVKLLFHSFRYPNELYEAVQTLAEKLEKSIPDLKAEANFYERLRIIYENLNSITDRTLRNSAIKLIEQTGISTEPPQKIAAALLTALKEYRKSLSLFSDEQAGSGPDT